MDKTQSACLLAVNRKTSWLDVLRRAFSSEHKKRMSLAGPDPLQLHRSVPLKINFSLNILLSLPHWTTTKQCCLLQNPKWLQVSWWDLLLFEHLVKSFTAIHLHLALQYLTFFYSTSTIVMITGERYSSRLEWEQQVHLDKKDIIAWVKLKAEI